MLITHSGREDNRRVETIESSLTIIAPPSSRFSSWCGCFSSQMFVVWGFIEMGWNIIDRRGETKKMAWYTHTAERQETRQDKACWKGTETSFHFLSPVDKCLMYGDENNDTRTTQHSRSDQLLMCWPTIKSPSCLCPNTTHLPNVLQPTWHRLRRPLSKHLEYGTVVRVKASRRIKNHPSSLVF